MVRWSKQGPEATCLRWCLLQVSWQGIELGPARVCLRWVASVPDHALRKLWCACCLRCALVLGHAGAGTALRMAVLQEDQHMPLMLRSTRSLCVCVCVVCVCARAAVLRERLKLRERRRRVRDDRDAGCSLLSRCGVVYSLRRAPDTKVCCALAEWGGEAGVGVWHRKHSRLVCDG